MTTSQAAVVLVGLTIGAVVTPTLARRGVRHVRGAGELPRRRRLLVAVLGATAGAGAAHIALLRTGLELLPALLVWSCALIALAVCDGMTKRVPTPLARQATLVVCLLIVGASFFDGWRTAVVAVACSLTAAGVLLTAWRIADAGFGDVRLAALGGLGLGHATARSLLLGLCVWAAVVAAQAFTVRSRGRSRTTQIAMGPGMVAGLLTAVLTPS